MGLYTDAQLRQFMKLVSWRAAPPPVIAGAMGFLGAASSITEPVFYACPDNDPTLLLVQPQLASWNVAGHSDQVRLAAALADAEERLTDRIADIGALRT